MDTNDLIIGAAIVMFLLGCYFTDPNWMLVGALLLIYTKM